MSVVNKMLNDLEKRNANENAAQGQYQAPLKPSHSKLWWSLVLFSAFGVAAAAWFYGAQVDRNVETTAPSVEVKKEDRIEPPLPTKPLKTEVAQTKVVDQPFVEQDAQLDSDNATQHEVPEPLKEPVQTTSSLEVNPSDSVKRSSFEVLVADAAARNNTKEMIDLMEQWIGEESDNLIARKKLAAAYFADNQDSAAEKLLKTTLVIFNNDDSTRLMLARLYAHREEKPKALDILKGPSQHPPLLHYRGSLARTLGRHQEAAASYQSLVAINGLDVKAWLGLATASDQLNDLEVSKTAYSRVLELAGSQQDIAVYARSRLEQLSGEARDE